ncbi:hypothetical protein ABW19_dt0202701 [Dactylella cylindrospora]|nr:hypothetical protein ABW19_dt0202701 [Dactylella cylindrospora]
MTNFVLAVFDKLSQWIPWSAPIHRLEPPKPVGPWRAIKLALPKIANFVLSIGLDDIASVAGATTFVCRQYERISRGIQKVYNLQHTAQVYADRAWVSGLPSVIYLISREVTIRVYRRARSGVREISSRAGFLGVLQRQKTRIDTIAEYIGFQMPSGFFSQEDTIGSRETAAEPSGTGVAKGVLLLEPPERGESEIRDLKPEGAYNATEEDSGKEPQSSMPTAAKREKFRAEDLSDINLGEPAIAITENRDQLAGMKVKNWETKMAEKPNPG